MADSINIGFDTEQFSISPDKQYSKVTIEVGHDSNGTVILYSAGDDTKNELYIKCPWGTQAMANNLLSALSSITYRPYTSESAYVHPASELGDKVTIGNGVVSRVYARQIEFSQEPITRVSAPADEESEDDYSYEDQIKREVVREVITGDNNVRATLTVAIDEIRLEVAGKIDGEEAQSLIDQTIGNITLAVSNGTQGNTSKITLTSGGISAVSDNITLTANAINLNTATITGQLTANNISGNGLDVTNATIENCLIKSGCTIGSTENGFQIGSNDLVGNYSVGSDEYQITLKTDGTLIMRPKTFEVGDSYTSSSMTDGILRLSSFNDNIGSYGRIDLNSASMGLRFYNYNPLSASSLEDYAINGQGGNQIGAIEVIKVDRTDIMSTSGTWRLSENTYLEGHNSQTLLDWIEEIAGATAIEPATTSTIGGIIVGSGLSVTTAGKLSVNTSTIATRSWAESTFATPYSAGNGISIDSSNKISVNISDSGTGLTFDEDGDYGLLINYNIVAGKLWVQTWVGQQGYLTSIPTASSTTKGGVKVDATGGLSVTNEVLKVNLGTGLEFGNSTNVIQVIDYANLAKKSDIKNATLTIQRNGTTVKTFTANASSNVTANITVPTKVSDLTNDSGFITSIPTAGTNVIGGVKIPASSVISNTSGAIDVKYGTGLDVDDDNNLVIASTVALKSDIPTVNNATLTIQRNGTTVKTFTANASSNVTANITVPTKTSDLTNDSGFITGIAWSAVTSKPFNTVGDGLVVDTNKILKVKAGNGIKIDSDADNGVAVDLSASDIPALTSAKISDFDSAVDTALGIGSGSTFLRKDGTWATPSSATNSTNTYNLRAYSSNEVTIGCNDVTAGASSNDKVYINYRDVYGGEINNGATQITQYIFGNRKGSTAGVTIKAGTFDGKFSGTIASSTTATTQATTDNSTKVATTAFVKSVLPTVPTYSGGDGITVSGTVISAKYGTGLTTDGNDALAIDTTTVALKSDIKTYTAGTGIAISSANVISNSGVRAVTINGNNLRVNTNGTNADLTIPYATSAGSAPASDVYAWAKAATKPTYTASEVGALPSNTTYVSKITTSAGAHTAISNASGAVSFNVPTKTSHLTNDSGFLTSHQTIYEENINWGPASVHKAGNVSPIGMALSSEHSANRLAFINGDALTVEYSSDGGATYTDYGLTASEKSAFCTTSKNILIGRKSGNYSTSSRTRITLTAQDGTHQYVYTDSKKLLIRVSTSGGMQVLIEYRSGTNYKNGGAWSTYGTYTLFGWSGWNDIPFIGTVGGSSGQTSQTWQVRLTFIMTSFNSSYPTTAELLCIRMFGTNSWSVPSNLANTGHLYSYDNSQNATFPAKVTATNFSGTFAGYTLAAACAKAVDTSIAAASTSTNLPTSKAVATFVEGKGYITSIPTATTNVIGGVKVPSGSGLSISSGSLGLNIGTGLDVDNSNNLIVSLSASNIPTITSAKISDFTSAAKTAIGIASSGSTFLRKDGQWASPTASSIAWSSVTSKPFTSVNESGGLEVASNSLQVKAGKGLAFNDDSGELEVAYTFAGGTNKFTVTPSGGTAQNVTITPSITVTAAVTDGVWDLTGTNGTNKVTYAVAPYPAATATQTWVTTAANAGKFYLGTNRVPYATTRLNYNGYFYARDVYANGQSVDSRLTALEEQICLIEGTKITMADGSEKNIEDVKVGDMVLSYNPSTGKQIEAMALQSVRTGIAKDFDVFIFDNGNVAEMFQEHSVYDVNLGYPHSHKEWKVGDVGLMADGEQSALARITTARHAIIKQRYVLCVSTGLYYANGILMGIWSSTKYNIVSRPCYNLNLPDKILNEFKRCGEMNDKANLLEINPDFIKQSKSIQQTIHRLSTEIEEAKKNLLDTDYLVAKFTEGLISTAEWLKSKASRANWRLIVNNNEAPLAEAKEQLESLKARIKGQVPSLKENYWESVAESDKLLPEFKAWYAEWSKENEEIN